MLSPRAKNNHVNTYVIVADAGRIVISRSSLLMTTNGKRNFFNKFHYVDLQNGHIYDCRKEWKD